MLNTELFKIIQLLFMEFDPASIQGMLIPPFFQVLQIPGGAGIISNIPNLMGF